METTVGQLVAELSKYPASFVVRVAIPQSYLDRDTYNTEFSPDTVTNEGGVVLITEREE